MTKILLIEDDKDLALNISELLELNHYKVSLASNGREALRLLEEWQPNLIISDVRMPEMDGSSLLSKLKDEARFRSIPFIFVSAIVESQEVRQLIDLGADDYLSKPFSFQQLHSAIESRLARFKEIQAGRGLVPWPFAKLLSSRELEIIDLVAQGRSIKEISAQLNLSRRTVENHKYRIALRIGVPRRKTLYSHLQEVMAALAPAE